MASTAPDRTGHHGAVDDRAALVLSGTVGSGKTTTAEAIGDRLVTSGVPHAVIDLDGLRRAWPPPPGDPFHHALTVANLRVVAGQFVAAGARRLVLAGVVEDRAAVTDYENAVGMPVRLVRLRVDLAVVHQRLHRRHALHPEDLHWHLHRADELDAVLDAGHLEDTVVDATGLTPAQAAAAVQAAVGWAP